jgi:tyrosyl-tRNA synthetase
MNRPGSPALLEELSWRGLLYQQTDALSDALARGPVTAYCGFDPTAPSLHVGSLVPIMGLVHLQRTGNRPIALVGGGTGMIGDPSGRPTERPLMTAEQVEENVRGIRAQLEHFLDFTGPVAARMMNNAEWLLPLRAVDFMRDVGKHFTVSYMLQKESVSARLGAGISYTEFSYMLLQAYDYLEIHRRTGATLQIGGSDQFGNITAGMELIRRTVGAESHGLTMPLVTTASGTKFGKSEAGAVWLDAARTSPYQFFQFWINVDDRDAGRYLRYFTLLPREEIEALDRTVAEHAERREAQARLAEDVTGRLHGSTATRTAIEVSAFLFGGSAPAELSAAALELLEREVPFAAVAEGDLIGSAGGDAGASTGSASRYDVYRMLTATGLAASNGAARRLLEQGGVALNGRRLGAADRYVDGASSLLCGKYIVVSKGKRDHALVRVLK